jgi:hypothetical protein
MDGEDRDDDTQRTQQDCHRERQGVIAAPEEAERTGQVQQADAHHHPACDHRSPAQA